MYSISCILRKTVRGELLVENNKFSSLRIMTDRLFFFARKVTLSEEFSTSDIFVFDDHQVSCYVTILRGVYRYCLYGLFLLKVTKHRANEPVGASRIVSDLYLRGAKFETRQKHTLF